MSISGMFRLDNKQTGLVPQFTIPHTNFGAVYKCPEHFQCLGFAVAVPAMGGMSWRSSCAEFAAVFRSKGRANQAHEGSGVGKGVAVVAGRLQR